MWYPQPHCLFSCLTLVNQERRASLFCERKRFPLAEAKFSRKLLHDGSVLNVFTLDPCTQFDLVRPGSPSSTSCKLFGDCLRNNQFTDDLPENFKPTGSRKREDRPGVGDNLHGSARTHTRGRGFEARF